jgi:polyisoprenoid-binding protein YceI
MKRIIITLLVITGFLSLQAQTTFVSKNGKITFDATSQNSPEKIIGVNEKAASKIDISTGTIEFAVLMKAFSFEKALMQEHFNENYVESDQFPKALFKGNIVNVNTVDLKKDGEYKVNIKGTMTLHGETKEITTEGVLIVKDHNVVTAKSKFSLLLEDYKIAIPSLVKDKVAKDAQIIIETNYLPYKSS